LIIKSLLPACAAAALIAAPILFAAAAPAEEKTQERFGGTERRWRPPCRSFVS
jgi:hypothetical protein